MNRSGTEMQPMVSSMNQRSIASGTILGRTYTPYGYWLGPEPNVRPNPLHSGPNISTAPYAGPETKPQRNKTATHASGTLRA